MNKLQLVCVCVFYPVPSEGWEPFKHP